MKQPKIKRKNYLEMRQAMYDVLSQVGTVSESLPAGHSLFDTYQLASKALDQFEEYGIFMGYLDRETGEVIK